MGRRVTKRFSGATSLIFTRPSMESSPSNAIYRKLGFTLMEIRQIEYPPGRFMRVHDWRLDLLEAQTFSEWRANFSV